MKFFDFENPIFKPVWFRAFIVGVCLVWGVVELSNGQGFWAALIGGLGLYAAWQFSRIDYSDLEDD